MKHIGEIKDGELVLDKDYIIESLRQQLAAANAKVAKVAELEEWKKSAITVFDGIDLQKIGVELALTVGDSIGPAILPAIVRFKSQIADLTARLEAQEAREPHPPTRHCMCDDCKPSFEEASEPVGWDKADQNWAGIDAATAFHLIDRHADDWHETGLMMNAWLAANTPQPTKQEASESTFAGWQRRLKFSSNGEVHPWEQCSAHEATDHFDRSPRHEYRQIFTTPQPTPTVQAAVAAAYRKAAEVCDSLHERNCQSITESGCPPCDCYADVFKQAILAIPHDDSALREICMRVAEEAFGDARRYKTVINLSDVVNRVLGEKK